MHKLEEARGCRAARPALLRPKRQSISPRRPSTVKATIAAVSVIVSRAARHAQNCVSEAVKRETEEDWER